MEVDEAIDAIAAAVESSGLLLVHDQRLPSATALVAGEPVLGSWWSHVEANTIYNALEALEDRIATIKLVSGKLTLIAPRLWPDLVAIGSAGLPWQLDRLSAEEVALFVRVEAASDPVLLDTPDLRTAGKRLEQRLLAIGETVHTDEGHHLKALRSWDAWADERAVASPFPESSEAMARFESIVEGWESQADSLLPWS